MACLTFFGSVAKEQESINELNSKIATLQQENQRLKQRNQELSATINNDEVNEVSHLRQQRDRLLQKNKELLVKLDEAQNLAIQAQRKAEELRKQMQLQSSTHMHDHGHKENKSAMVHEDTKKAQVSDAHVNDEEKTTPTPVQETQERKLNLNRVQDQIMVLSSELMRHKSLLFVCKPQYLQKTGDNSNEIVNFSFLHFLQTSLSDKVVDQLFGKFKSNAVDGKDLLNLLTLSGVIYSVKLHKMQTGDNGKPKLNLNAMKQSMHHLAAYIIRKFGHKTDETEHVTAIDDYGQMKSDSFHVIKAQFEKQQFRNDVQLWITDYIDNEGQLQIE